MYASNEVIYSSIEILGDSIVFGVAKIEAEDTSIENACASIEIARNSIHIVYASIYITRASFIDLGSSFYNRNTFSDGVISNINADMFFSYVLIASVWISTSSFELCIPDNAILLSFCSAMLFN